MNSNLNNVNINIDYSKSVELAEVVKKIKTKEEAQLFAQENGNYKYNFRLVFRFRTMLRR
jgi:hypothetical protein